MTCPKTMETRMALNKWWDGVLADRGSSFLDVLRSDTQDQQERDHPRCNCSRLCVGGLEGEEQRDFQEYSFQLSSCGE